MVENEPEIVETFRMMKDILAQIERRIRYIRENEVDSINEFLKNSIENLQNIS